MCVDGSRNHALKTGVRFCANDAPPSLASAWWSVIAVRNLDKLTIAAVNGFALEVRDRHCIYPYCRAPASRCHVHHLNEWLRDQGFTDVEVLGLFCDTHHRHLHVEDLVAQREIDGTVTIRNRASWEVIARATKANR